MKRLFTTKHKVTPGKSKTNYPTGRVVINSTRLKHCIGKEIRIIVYLIGEKRWNQKKNGAPSKE